MGAGEIDEYLELIQRYGKFFADMYFHPVIFIMLVVIIISVYVIRYFVFINEYKTEAIEKGVLKEYKIYTASHMSIQLLINFFVSYVVIKFTNALIDSYIINWILAPTIGLIAGIIVDYKVIAPIENKSGFLSNPLGNKESVEKKDVESANSVNNITINVGSKNTTKEKEAKVEPMNNEITITESNEDIIKSLIHMQEEQSRQLKTLYDLVDAIRDDIVTNRRYELHDSMMECIKRGYVTTDEYDRISEKMKTYGNLKGNHIQSLYQTKFLTLPIR